MIQLTRQKDTFSEEEEEKEDYNGIQKKTTTDPSVLTKLLLGDYTVLNISERDIIARKKAAPHPFSPPEAAVQKKKKKGNGSMLY